MFNKTIYNTETKVVAVTKEIEKTITPDKVTEMYDSVKEQVKSDLIRAFTFKSNSLEGTVMMFSDDVATAVTRYKAGYKLNGEMFEIDGVLNREDKLGIDSIITKVVNHYSKTIASRLIQETAQQHELLIK